MRTVAPLTMAYAYVGLTVVCAAALAIAHASAPLVGGVVGVAAALGYLWFQSAPTDPGTVPRLWRVAVGICGALLVGTCIVSVRRRLDHHEYIDVIWPVFWGLGFAVTAMELLTGKRFREDEQPARTSVNWTPLDR